MAKLAMPDLADGPTAWTVYENTGGTIAADFVYGSQGALLFTHDGGDSAKPLYVQYTLAANKASVLVRMVFETGLIFNTTVINQTIKLLELLDSSDTVIATLSVMTGSLTDGTRMTLVLTENTMAPATNVQRVSFMYVNMPSMGEISLGWGAGANTGFVFAGGPMVAGMFGKINLNNAASVVRKIRVGIIPDTATVPSGMSMAIHKIDVYDGQPFNLSEIHKSAADGAFYVNVPALVAVTAPTGFTPTKVEIQNGSGAWTDITLATGSGARGAGTTDEIPLYSGLVDNTLFASANVYDGCFVEPTLRGLALFPPIQVLDQEVNTAWLSHFPPWLSTPVVGYNGTNGNYWETVAYNIWRVRESYSGSGVYWVGVPGANVALGVNTVRITVNGSAYTQSFTAVAMPKGDVTNNFRAGRRIVMAFDDFGTTQPILQRQCFNGRRVVPTLFVPWGTSNPSPYVRDILNAAGWELASHGYRHINPSTLTLAQNQTELLRGKRAALLSGDVSGLYASPYGSITASGGEDIVAPGLVYYRAFRSTLNILANAVPLVLSSRLTCLPMGNSTYGGNDAANAAALLAAIKATSEQSICITLMHTISAVNDVNNASIGWINAFLDLAEDEVPSMLFTGLGAYIAYDAPATYKRCRFRNLLPSMAGKEDDIQCQLIDENGDFYDEYILNAAHEIGGNTGKYLFTLDIPENFRGAIAAYNGNFLPATNPIDVWEINPEDFENADEKTSTRADGAYYTNSRALKIDNADVATSTRAEPDEYDVVLQALVSAVEAVNSLANAAATSAASADGKLPADTTTKLARLNADIDSRAPASTALSTDVWTNAKAGYIDSAISGVASAVWGISARTLTSFGDLATNITTLLDRVGSWTGTGINTLLGAFKAIMRKDATVPSDIGGTFAPDDDSLEAISEQDIQGNWTDAEKKQIRDALGVDGDKTTAADGQIQDIKTRTDLIGSTKLTYSSPASAAGNFTIYAGADYLREDGLDLRGTKTNYSGPSLVGASAVLRFIKKDDFYNDVLNAALEVADVNITVNGSTVVLSANLTAAESALLATNPPEDEENYIHQFIVTTASPSSIIVMADGVTTVKKTIGEEI